MLLAGFQKPQMGVSLCGRLNFEIVTPGGFRFGIPALLLETNRCLPLLTRRCLFLCQAMSCAQQNDNCQGKASWRDKLHDFSIAIRFCR